MNRLTLAILAAPLAVLAACASSATSTTGGVNALDATQGAYAVESAYIAAAHAEAAVLPKLSAADQVNVRALDGEAYAAIVTLRTAAQSGGNTAVELAAATAAVSALTASLTPKTGA